MTEAAEQHKPSSLDLPAPDDVVHFLGTIFEPTDYVLVRPVESWVEGSRKRSLVIYECQRWQRACMLSKAGPWQSLLTISEKHRANLFFGVCPRVGPKGQFDLSWQIRTVRVLWADLDHCTVEEALKRCEDAGLLRPSIVVRSGNGVHLYWILREPYLIDDVAQPPAVLTGWVDQGRDKPKRPIKYIKGKDGELGICLYLENGKTLNPDCPWGELSAKARHVQDVLGGLAAKIGGDHTTDLARCLRLPSTLNRKDERNGRQPLPCELAECDPTRRYPFADLEGFAVESPARQRREKVAVIQLPTPRSLKVTLKSRKREDRFRALVNACASAEPGQRSERDWSLICWAVENGVDPEEVWDTVAGVGKFAEQGRAYFDRTLGKAKIHTQEKTYDRMHAKSIGKVSRNGEGLARRPEIILGTDEYRVNDEAIKALSDHKAAPEVYQRGNVLVTVLRARRPGKKAPLKRPEGTPRISVIPAARVREIMTRVADFQKWVTTKKGDKVLVPTHPPDWCVAAVVARGDWQEIRPLEGVLEAPTLRPDWTVLDAPGWDAETGLLYEPNAEYPSILPTPSKIDAINAAERLLDLVGDYPFVGTNERDNEKRDSHRAAWMAGLLTALVRNAIAGPCPLFLFDANCPATGKSMLADVIALVATGRVMSRTTFPNNDEELRKRLTAVALAGDRLMLFDNVEAGQPLGGSSLDAALTGTTWQDRLLGRSKMTPELPLHTVFFATGNNVMLKGDALRRVIPCRIETNEERPEERAGFKYPNLLEHVRADRPRQVCDVLTVLRGFAVAGCPQASLPAFGSYEAWSGVVRQAVFWATGADPWATRRGLRASDPALNNLAALLEGWAELPGGRTGLTVAEALQILNNPDQKDNYLPLRGALMEWSHTDKLPGSGTIGCKLRSLRHRVVSGLALDSETGHGGGQLWRVVPAGSLAAFGDDG